MSIAATQSIASTYSANQAAPRPVSPARAEELSQSVVVSLSLAAQARLNGPQNAGHAVDDLLTSSSAQIFGSIKSLRIYPENLAGQLDNDSISEADRTAIANRMGARETAALGFARSTFDPAIYAKAYIQYYDSLSPEEQNADRYRGTREQAVSVYKWSSEAKNEPVEDLSGPQDPILMLFEKISTMDFKIEDEKGFIARMREAASPLLDSAINGEQLAQNLEDGLARFSEIQGLIGAARDGEPAALQSLQALADQGV